MSRARKSSRAGRGSDARQMFGDAAGFGTFLSRPVGLGRCAGLPKNVRVPSPQTDHSWRSNYRRPANGHMLRERLRLNPLFGFLLVRQACSATSETNAHHKCWKSGVALLRGSVSDQFNDPNRCSRGGGWSKL